MILNWEWYVQEVVVYVQVVIDVSSRFELKSIPIMSGHGYRKWTRDEEQLLFLLRPIYSHLPWGKFRLIYDEYVPERWRCSADALSSKYAALLRLLKIQYPLLPQADLPSVYGYFPTKDPDKLQVAMEPSKNMLHFEPPNTWESTCSQKSFCPKVCRSNEERT